MRQFLLAARAAAKPAGRGRGAGLARQVIYLATAQVGDEEFAQRVAAHRARRPAQWDLIEAPASLAQANAAAAPERLLLVDCLTLWLVGFLTADAWTNALAPERAALLQLLPQLPGKIVLVSNEIGWGVVPMGAATRWFVDELGWLNQAVAACCERVTWRRPACRLVLKMTHGQNTATRGGHSPCQHAADNGLTLSRTARYSAEHGRRTRSPSRQNPPARRAVPTVAPGQQPAARPSGRTRVENRDLKYKVEETRARIENLLARLPEGRNEPGAYRGQPAGTALCRGLPKEEQASLVEAVALLEQRMAEVRDVGRVVEVDKIAIIAALNLANDLLKLQKNPPPSASDLDIEENPA